jgi:hypothetical protein
MQSFTSKVREHAEQLESKIGERTQQLRQTQSAA